MTIQINDLSPPEIDITIPQGSDVDEFFIIYTDEAQTSPLDLTGFTAQSMVRTSYDANSPILTLSTTDGTIMLGAKIQNNTVVSDSPINGGIALKYQSGTTTAVRFKGDSLDCVRDLELTDSSGIVRRVLQGNFTLSRESTR